VSARIDVLLPPVLRRAKAAYRKSTEACGGQEEAAKATGKAQQRISLYGHANSDAFAPLDTIIAQEDAARGTPGHPHITRFLALEAGYGLFKLPGSEAAGTIWSKHAAEVAKEANEVVAGLCDDLADGKVTPREAKKRVPDVDEAIEALVRLRTSLIQCAEDE
jgi:hypothetical protein